MATAKKHVFLSYARADHALAGKIRKYLKKLDVPVWQDVQELEAGDDWEAEIIRALRQSSALILILTKQALRSTFVSFESAFSRGAGAKLIPVLAEKVRLPRPLSSTNVVDFTAKRKPWTALADALNKPALERARADEAPRMIAHMAIVDGEPWYEEGDELAFKLQIEDAPSEASEVWYKLHSKTYSKSYRHKRSRKSKKKFKLWRQAYGDILISATIVTPRKELVVRDTLYNMLKASHGADRRRPVQEALAQIRDH